MKKSFVSRMGIVALLLSLLSFLQPGRLQAQTLVMPSIADTVWYNSVGVGGASYILGLNTAMIDYNNVALGSGTLMVSDYYGNGTAGGVVFRDQPSGFQKMITYHVPSGWVPNYYMFSSPDIIVGNDTINPLTNYKVAVAYVRLNTLTGAVTPQIDYWEVAYEGPGSFGVDYLGSTFFDINGSNTTHIDVIAEAGNTTATGFPMCNKFIFTCDYFNSGTGASGVDAYYSSLNSPLFGVATATRIVGGTAGSPDVAAIQRTVGSGVDDFGLFTYVDGSGLEYIEWDATLGAGTSGGATLDPSISEEFLLPRIDAPDDYTVNAPGAFSYYKVAAEVFNGTTTTSNAYDDVSYLVTPVMTYPGSGNSYAPTVAFGGNDDTMYMIAHSSDDNTISGYPAWNTFMEPYGWLNPFSIAPAPSSAIDYFLVNDLPYASSSKPSGVNLTAISTPCNNPSDQTLVAWTYDTSHNSTVWFKTTTYGGTNGFAFRQGAPGAATAKWDIYPNPATADLTITAPVATATYQITDMPGQTVQRGSVQAGAQTIDISALTPGTYIMSLYEENNRDYTQIFVKQ